MKQLIEGGRLLTAGRLDGAFANLLIDGDKIVAVLRPDEPVTDDARRIDAADRLLIPGLVNAHTHAMVHLCKGRLLRKSALASWLRFRPRLIRSPLRRSVRMKATVGNLPFQPSDRAVELPDFPALGAELFE